VVGEIETIGQGRPAPPLAPTATGSKLRRQLAVAERRGHLRAVALILPVLLFIVVSFAIPVVLLLSRAIIDPSIAGNLPKTVAALAEWDGKDLPSESAFAALVADLHDVQARNAAAFIAKRLNYEISGIRSRVIASARKAAAISAPPYKEQMIAADRMWGDRLIWAKIKQSGQVFTTFYLLRVLDLDRDAEGRLVPVPGDQAVYRTLLWRTFSISLIVTLLTLILGYPVAYVLATTPPRISNLLMVLVLVPFWTSLLVRTTAWFVLLQDNGPINDFLLFVNLTEQPLHLIFSRFGTIVAMTHIQLPFTILPIYSVMKSISPSYMRAARSLGGGPFYSFFKVYFPLTLPGIGAGCLLTFILSLGYYITPALVGGPSDQMISGVIATSMNLENNWGKASALSAILLVATLVLFYIYNRLVGIDKVKLG
jgi:putative spermidine/putrescine transport system permease protein